MIGDLTSQMPRHLVGQLRSYAGAVRWLALMLWVAFRWRVILAIVGALAGVIVIGAGLGLSLHYAQALETGDRLELGPIVAAARAQATLAVVVAVVLVVLLAGAGILLLAQRNIVSMAAELNHRVRTDIALAYGGELPETSAWSDDRAMWRALWVLQTRDARRSAIVTRNLMRNATNVVIAVVGVGALFYLEPQVTLALLAFMAVGLFAYYRANTASVQATRRYEAIAPATRRQLHRLLPIFQTLSQPQLGREEFETALGPADITAETVAFRDRFGAHIYAQFLNLAIMGVVLAGLIGYMGRRALLGAMPWTRVIAYLVVLRIALSGIHAIFNAFAFFSRFYPSIDRLHRFFAACNSATSSERLDELPLRTCDEALRESEEMSSPVPKGEVIEVALPVGLSRYSLGLLAQLFAGDDVERRRRLLGHIAMAAPLSAPPAPASMRSLLMLDPSWTAETLRARLGDEAGAVEDAIGLEPDAVVPEAAWERLPERAAARLVVTVATASPRSVLAIDRELAVREGIEHLEDVARDKIVLVCTDGGTPDGDALRVTRKVVVSPRGEVLAVGSPRWIAEHRQAITERLAQDGPQLHDEPADDDFDDE